MRYYPFGEVRWQNGSTPTDRTFTGQLAEPSGLGSLMNYNAREYSPVLGRFLSADSIVPSGPAGPAAFGAAGIAAVAATRAPLPAPELVFDILYSLA